MRPDGSRNVPGLAAELAGADCHAVVIGTGRHPAGSALPALPSATRSARALAEVLSTTCGMGDRVDLLIDPAAPAEILTAVEEAARRAQGGVLLVCFVGHGLLGPGDHLYLATSAATGPDSTPHAVPYTEIRNLLADAPLRPIVVLDCCFSGLAEVVERGGRPDPYATARPDGSFLLASAMHYAASFAPQDAEYTLFTGEVIRLLREGDTSGPRWITLSALYRHLDRRFQGTQARPHAGSAGRLGDLAIVRNASHVRAVAATDNPEDADSYADGAEDAHGTDSDGTDIETDADASSPYPGMRPYLPEQHHLFFGREELTRALMERTRRPEPVVLVGLSGVGKSSLLRAGLGPAMEAAGQGPVLLVPGPGAQPFRTLVAAWAQAVGRSFSEVEQALGAGKFLPPADAKRPVPGALVIDQAEEIFTLCSDPEERDLFVRALTGPRSTDADPAGPAGPHIVLGMRADYYEHCLRDPRLATVVQQGQFTVPPMTEAELLRAIEGPAEHAGLMLEDGLAQLLLRDLGEHRAGALDAVALPFLAHVLQETWARRRRGRLTFSGYYATGGLSASVARAAEAIHDSLDTEAQRELRELLLQLVQLVDRHGRVVRRRVRLRDIRPNNRLLARLAKARLVVVDGDEVQLSHDAVLHAWPRLRGWIEEDLSGLLLQQRLGAAADAWEESGRPRELLFRGGQLQSARELRDKGGRILPLRPVDREFVAAGVRRRVWWLRAIAAAVCVLVAVSGAAVYFGVESGQAQRAAEARETRLVAQQLADRADSLRERDPRTALQLSLAAYRTAVTPESRSSLYAAYMSLTPVDLPAPQRKAVLSLAYRHDGKVLAAGHVGGRVQLWDISRPAVPERAAAIELPDDGDGGAVVAYHPRNAVLAVHSRTRLELWDTADPYHPKRLARRSLPDDVTYILAFSPDGRTLAVGSGSESGRLRLWDVSHPADPTPAFDRVVAGAALISLAYSPDGTYLVTGNGVSGPNGERPAQVRVWDVRDALRPVLRDTARTSSVSSVAFHPRRPLVATAGGAGLAYWKVEGGPGKARLRYIKPGQDTIGAEWKSTGGGVISSIAFNRDGTLLAGADNTGGQALVRQVADGYNTLYESGGYRGLPTSEEVQSVTYSPDGGYLAAGDVSGAIRMWPERPAAPVVEGTLGAGAPGESVISRDGKLLVTSTQTPGNSPYAVTSTVRVWDVSDPDSPRVRFTVPDGWEARSFLPGGGSPVLLTHHWQEGTKRHVYRYWKFGGSGRPMQGKELRFAADDVISSSSPDGRLVALGRSMSRGIELWDTSDPLAPVRRSEIDVPVGSSFDTGSVWFIGPKDLGVVENRRNLQIWDVSHPERPRRARLVKDAAARGGASYFHDARLLVTEEVGQSLRLWNMRNPARPKQAGRIPGAPGSGYPVGRDQIVTVLQDGTLRFWDVRDPDHPKEFKDRTLRIDGEPGEVRMLPDGRSVLTSNPYRIWPVDKHGRWRTPSTLTLSTGDRVVVSKGDHPYLAVEPGDEQLEGREWTFLLTYDTDSVYDALCTADPSSIGKKQWAVLFPDLDDRYRGACGT
ncbi:MULTISPECIES: caspase, EACC1-associated type [unclassified Streptomyces]|uniref:caspase, EACC1-associated type n=1 Tax=unclassified Streptomyces TaxID=2593676 RepID=UPI003245F96B